MASACNTIKYIFGNDIHIISRRPTKLDECQYMKMHIPGGGKKRKGATDPLESSSALTSESSRGSRYNPFPFPMRPPCTRWSASRDNARTNDPPSDLTTSLMKYLVCEIDSNEMERLCERCGLQIFLLSGDRENRKGFRLLLSSKPFDNLPRCVGVSIVQRAWRYDVFLPNYRIENEECKEVSLSLKKKKFAKKKRKLLLTQQILSIIQIFPSVLFRFNFDGVGKLHAVYQNST